MTLKQQPSAFSIPFPAGRMNPFWSRLWTFRPCKTPPVQREMLVWPGHVEVGAVMLDRLRRARHQTGRCSLLAMEAITSKGDVITLLPQAVFLTSLPVVGGEVHYRSSNCRLQVARVLRLGRVDVAGQVYWTDHQPKTEPPVIREGVEVMRHLMRLYWYRDQ